MPLSLLVYVGLIILTVTLHWLWLKFFNHYDSTIPYDPKQLPRLIRNGNIGLAVVLAVQAALFAGYHYFK